MNLAEVKPLADTPRRIALLALQPSALAEESNQEEKMTNKNRWDSFISMDQGEYEEVVKIYCKRSHSTLLKYTINF